LSWERCPPPLLLLLLLHSAAGPIVRRRQGIKELTKEPARRYDRVMSEYFQGNNVLGAMAGLRGWGWQPPAPPRHSSCPVPTGGEWHGGSEWTSTKGDPLLPGPSCWAVTATNS